MTFSVNKSKIKDEIKGINKDLEISNKEDLNENEILKLLRK